MSAAALPRNSQADQSFGPRLRRERERRKIALASIAANSKISASLFEDLERGDVSRWPSGIFRKSFIRAYAQAVGLDPDETAREFLERFPDPNPDLAPRTPSAAPAETSTAVRLAAVPASTAERTPMNRRPLTPAERAVSIAWDAGMIITLGLLLYAVFGSLWMPLCVVMAIYYAGGILLFGGTPGAALHAPSVPALTLRRSAPSSSDESSSSSTDSDPAHQTGERTVRPYRAREI